MLDENFMTKYNTVKDIEKSTVCDECNFVWKTSDTEIKSSKVTVRKEKLTVTYFVCPNCNKLYVVTVDNKETIHYKRLLRYYTDVFTRTQNRSLLPKITQYSKFIIKQTGNLKLNLEKYGTFYQK